jgi:hypothetical protein
LTDTHLDRLVGSFELRVMLVQETQPFEFHFLGAGIVLKALNALSFHFVFVRQSVVLLLEQTRLAMLAGQRVKPLRPAQHNSRVSGKSGQGGKSCNGSKEGTKHQVAWNSLLLFISFFWSECLL